MGNLSIHFDREEFACKCGCGFDTVDALLLMDLELIRVHFDRPVIITSGCRCKAHNDSLPNSSTSSQHLLGRAADIVVGGGIPPSLVQEFANQAGFNGIGHYEGFTHIDSRSGKASW